MKPSISLLPTSATLLDRLRAAVDQVRSGETLSEMGQDQLRVIDVVLAELRCREETAPYRRIYQEGRDLLQSEVTSDCPDMAALDDLPVELVPVVSPCELHRLLGRLSGALAARTAASAAGDQRLAFAAMDWEQRLYSLRASAPAVVEAVPGASIDSERLNRWLAARGWVTRSCRKLIGGFQKDTLFVTVDGPDGTCELVVRAEKADRFVQLDASSVVDEFAIVQAVHAAGIPSARPLWVEADASMAGVRFMVSGRVIGRTPSAALRPDELGEAALRSIFETLADIHSMPIAPLLSSCIGHWAHHASLADNTRAAVAGWGRQLWAQATTASPTATLLQAWLLRHAPESSGSAVLLHADYAPHNLMLDGDRVAAVLDWESARLGDPAEDLSYLLLYFAGRVERAAAIGWYTARLGRGIPEMTLRYFDVYNTIKLVMGGGFAGALVENDPNASLAWCYLNFHVIGAGISAASAALNAYVAADGPAAGNGQ